MMSILNLVKTVQTIWKWKGFVYSQHGDSTILFLSSKKENGLKILFWFIKLWQVYPRIHWFIDVCFHS